MKLVMTLLVRDEEDILEANIEYHFSRGVDFIIATDNLSVDRTSDILSHYSKQGRLQVIQESADDYSQAIWVTRMARIAHDEYSADWVFHCDADEFWWVDSSISLKDALSNVPKRCNVLNVHRFNFLPCNNEGEEFFKSMLTRELASESSLGKLLLPKIFHRSHPLINIAQGNHSAYITNVEETLESTEAPHISILHFPLRSYKQFSNKIKKGGAAYERNTYLDISTGDSWRHLYKMYQAGDLEKYYMDQVLPKNETDDLLNEGKLVKDTRLLEYLNSHRIGS